MICALFGHSFLFDKEKVKERLKYFLTRLILLGYTKFLIGTHGEFDKIALSVCRDLKKNYDIEINLVFTSLKTIQKEYGDYQKYYNDICFMSYPIENYYFKNQITMNNRFMVDDSDLVLCYVDDNKQKSGAKKIMKYAIKKSKKVLNIYKKTDNCFYGLTKEEIDILFKNYIKN